MRKAESVHDPRNDRFKVVDESVTTWAVIDQDDMSVVEGNLGHFEASQLADKLNAGHEEGH